MRIHRGYLFWGIFFILLGGIPLLERAGVVELEGIGDRGRLWPLVLVAIGAAIVLARNGAGLILTVAAAVIIGGIAGSALATNSGWFDGIGECVGMDGDEPLSTITRSGSLTGPAHVELELSCGSLDVQAGPTTGGTDEWTLSASYRGDPPVVTSGATSLSVRSPDLARRQEWALLVPVSDLASLTAQVNAGSSTIDVTSAQLKDLRVQVNAGDTDILAQGAAIALLDVQVNAGSAQVTLGGDTDGQLHANAGSIELCVPPDADLTIGVSDSFAFSTNLAERGLFQSGSKWTRAGTGPSITLGVEGNAASFTLDPAGGCT